MLQPASSLLSTMRHWFAHISSPSAGRKVAVVQSTAWQHLVFSVSGSRTHSSFAKQSQPAEGHSAVQVGHPKTSQSPAVLRQRSGQSLGHSQLGGQVHFHECSGTGQTGQPSFPYVVMAEHSAPNLSRSCTQVGFSKAHAMSGHAAPQIEVSLTASHISFRVGGLVGSGCSQITVVQHEETVPSSDPEEVWV